MKIKKLTAAIAFAVCGVSGFAVSAFASHHTKHVYSAAEWAASSCPPRQCKACMAAGGECTPNCLCM